MIVGVGGELVAINGAFAVSPSEASIRVVVAVLALGTLVIGLRAARHWLDAVIAPGTARTTIYVAGLVLGLATVAGTQVVVINTIHDALAVPRIAAQSHR